uniref:Olfactory receptor n=1 Tax=Pyxicephalus adspersus TaxID=30357 RepID=A0AAV3A8F4_PYXAD|nr:TPA: hypothetical protein GDO54_013732 [Pyxicephalus adspersus]
MQNSSAVTEFLLLGLYGTFYGVRIFFFIVFLAAYITSLSGNFLIILLVSTIIRLNAPMYNFLWSLSLCEIVLTSVLVPRVLNVLIQEIGTIEFYHCIFQFYMLSSSVATECFILSLMSYDRYLAICNPLHYFSLMKNDICLKLNISCWLCGYALAVVGLAPLSTLQFCGPNVMDHFFCDLTPILKLSCTDTYAVEMEIFVFTFPVISFPFLFIICTYIRIIVTILKLPQATSRKKAFSTCSSHLTVVSTYYGTLTIMYVVPSKGFSFNANKYWSLLYSIATPLLNPIVYSLRNWEIKEGIKKLFNYRQSIYS